MAARQSLCGLEQVGVVGGGDAEVGVDHVGEGVHVDAAIRPRPVEPPHREVPLNFAAMLEHKQARGRHIYPGGERHQAVCIFDRSGLHVRVVVLNRLD